jgi:hypothetical protein
MRPTTEGKGEKRDMAEDLRVPLSQVPGFRKTCGAGLRARDAI